MTRPEPIDQAAMLASIVASSDDAIVSKTLEGIITSWNAAAERLFGYSEAEAIGQSIRIIIPPDRQTEEDIVLARIRRGEKVDHIETIRRAKDGRLVPVSLTISPMRNAVGDIVGASKIARDISLDKDLRAARERALEAAEAANRAKDEFLAMFGHELRNPLAAMAGAADLLDRVKGIPELVQPRAVLKRQVRHLRKLVDDVLDAVRVRAGQVVLEHRPLNLADAVECAVEALQSGPLSPERVIETDYESVAVLADPVRLDQMILNLVTNAIRYTPPDRRVFVSVRGDAEWAVLKIRDEGLGIAAHLLPRIFDLFVQGERSSDSPRVGLGVGLSIVRNLAELHGGDVDAHSNGPGHGSTFTLRLPAIPLEAVPEPKPGVLAHVAPQRILIVEDNRDVREMLAEFLRDRGHDVHEAETGTQAVELAKSFEPHVMLVDLCLPILDGFEVARAVRRMPIQPRRLVALSGYGQLQDRKESLRAGFDDHIVKPIEVERLMLLLQESEQSGLSH